ncbi:MAG: heparinase II/III-family protein [Lentisphaeria bacterium]|nr:heparinase II/III-family protein [Lentisphaeria bacterium]
MTVRALVTGAVLMSALNAAPLHPRIFIQPADLPRLRNLAGQTQGDAFGNVPTAAWLKLKAKADRFVQAAPYSYTVNMPGLEGATPQKWSYTLSDTRPPAHDEFKHYPPWTAMFQERPDSITTRLRFLLLAHAVTGEEKYFERARKIVLHLSAWDDIWTDRSYGGGKPCLDTGHAAVWVAIFHDWCAAKLTAAEAATVRGALADKGVAPIAEMIESIAPYHNYTAAIGGGLALGAISLLGHDERAEAWLDLAIRRLRLYMDQQGSDGGSMEGPGYGTYAANQLADVLWALDGIGRAEELADHPYLRSLPRYCISLLDPGTGKMPCFGDGGPTVGFINLMRVLALQGDSDAAWYCRRVAGLTLDTPRAFLSVDDTRIQPRKPEFRTTACYRDIGYAVLRDGFNPDSAFLAVKCGPPTAKIGHNHFDQGSFLLRFGTEWIGWDPGYRSYFDPPRRRYTTGTFGHNTVVLDLDDDYIASTTVAAPGKDQVSLVGGRILELFAGDRVDFVRTDIAPAYNSPKRKVLDRFQRDFLYIKPGVVVILDELAAPQPHTFSFLLHAPRGASYELGENRATATAPGAFLDCWFFTKDSLSLRAGQSPADGAYGAWLAASTKTAKSARIVTVLAPRLNDMLVMNPGFENGMGGWQPRNMAGYLENHVIDTEVSHGGKASGRIDNGGYYYSRKVPVTPGTKIRTSWWAKCTADTGAASLLYYWKNGKCVGNTKGPGAKVDEWGRFEIADTIPGGIDEVCLALQFFGEGQCWYDDVEIVLDHQGVRAVPTRVRELAPNRAVLIERGDARHLLLVGGREFQFEDHRYAATGALAWFALDGAPAAFSSDGAAPTRDGKPLPRDNGAWNRP